MRFRGCWWSHQFLLPHDLCDIHEREMYDCDRPAYGDRVKVVSLQVVPDLISGRRQCNKLRVLIHRHWRMELG